MWLRRTRYEALVADATTAQTLARNEALLRQQVEWLSTMVNKLEAERALYLQRLLGLNVPVARVTPVAPVAGVGVPLEDDAREPVAGIDTGALMLGAAAFEDMGDAAATREGIRSEVVVQL